MRTVLLQMVSLLFEIGFDLFEFDLESLAWCFRSTASNKPVDGWKLDYKILQSI